jgi:transcriptional regulator with XRE-family HTH domain
MNYQSAEDRSLYSGSDKRRSVLPRPAKEVVLSKAEIGRRVRALRNARDMTQAELASAIGTHAPNISSIEHGLRGLSLQQAIKLSKALSVGPEEILGPGRPAFEKKRPPSAKLLRRLERLQALPRPKQRTILDLLDAYLDKHGSDNGHR